VTCTLLLLLGSALAAEPVTLAPDLPAIRAVAAPLYAVIPDADRLPDGPRIVPPEACDWIADPDHVFELGIKAPAAGADTALLTVWNWRNQAVWEQRYPLPCDQALSYRVAGHGTWLLTLDTLADGQPVARQARAIAAVADQTAARQQWASDQYQLGICAFPGRLHWTNDFGNATPPGLTEQDAREREAGLMARAGFGIVRPDVPVDWRGEDQPLDFSRMDAAIAPWTERGFRLMLQLSRPGDWAILEPYANVTDPKWRYPKRIDPTVRLNVEVAKRYGQQADFIELLNEPDNPDFWMGTVEEYLQLLRTAAPSLRQAAPGVALASGSYTLIEPVETGQMAVGQRDLVDLVAYHSHGDVEKLDAMFSAMQAVHAAAGYEQPIWWNTEMGSAAWRLDQEMVQAQVCTQKLLYCWATGHRGAMLYASRETGGPRLGHADYGILDHFLSPRFLYGTCAGMVEALVGARFERALPQSGARYAYVFRKDGALVVAAFMGNRQPGKLKLSSDATQAVVIDAMGNRTPVAGGTVELSFDGYPAYVELVGASKVDAL